jgi:hypothetical protein
VKPPAYSYFKFVVVLGVGTVLALLLCIQCVRTYLYTDAVLVPQHAEREAERWNRRSACIGTRGRTRARVSLQTCSMDTHSRSGGKHTLSGRRPARARQGSFELVGAIREARSRRFVRPSRAAVVFHRSCRPHTLSGDLIRKGGVYGPHDRLEVLG